MVEKEFLTKRNLDWSKNYPYLNKGEIKPIKRTVLSRKDGHWRVISVARASKANIRKFYVLRGCILCE